MEALIVIMTILFNFLLVGGILFFTKSYYKNAYEATKRKISDAEIFKIMERANHFITSEQLAGATELTQKEASKRLGNLAYYGALKRYYDSNSGISNVFQLRESVPLFDALPAKIDGLNEQQIIDVILLHVDDYQITKAELVVIFGIDISEAQALIKRLKKADKLTVLYKGFRKIYAIKKPLTNNIPVLRAKPLKNKQLQKMAIPDQERIKIPDSDVLQLAIDNKGKLTPTFLCIKLKISMDEAKMKLEDLYDEGVFVMNVNEKNAVLEYQLNDESLLG